MTICEEPIFEDPVLDTPFVRRQRGGCMLAPQYVGAEISPAQVCMEAEAAGYQTVLYCGNLYMQFCRRWFRANWEVERAK